MRSTHCLKNFSTKRHRAWEFSAGQTAQPFETWKVRFALFALKGNFTPRNSGGGSSVGFLSLSLLLSLSLSHIKKNRTMRRRSWCSQPRDKVLFSRSHSYSPKRCWMDGVEGWKDRPSPSNESYIKNQRSSTKNWNRRGGKIINKNSCWLIWVHIGTFFFVSCGSFFTVIGALTPQSISSPLPLCKSRKLVFLSGNWWVLTNWTHSPSRFFFFFWFFSSFFKKYFPSLPFPWQGFVSKQSVGVLKQRRWIRRGSVTAYETWQVIPNYWKLANCWSISSQPDMFYTRTNTKWTRLLEGGLFSRACVRARARGCDFNVWLNSPNVLFCFFFFFASFLHLFFFPPHVSFLTQMTLCVVRASSPTHTHTHRLFLSACCLLYFHT